MDITTMLNEQSQELRATLDTLTKKLRNAPNATLRVQPHKKSFQYYIISKPGDTKGSYLPRAQIRKAALIVQRDYNRATATTLKEQIATIETFTGKPFEINAPEYYTASGVRVRSKSEVIIADALDHAGVPYRYEYPTSVKGWGTKKSFRSTLA